MNDQYIIPLFVAGSMLLTLFAFFLIAYLLVHKQKQNAFREKQNAFEMEKRQMAFEHQNNLMRTRIEEQENIMNQISKELHDNIKSVLGFAQQNMYRLEDLSTSNEQKALIDKTVQVITQVVEDVHNMSHSLNSHFVKSFGLTDALNKEMDAIRLSRNITCNLEVKGNALRMSPERELHIFRIAQEAAQNCLKHAKATIITFTLEYTSDLFVMTIADNGIGFDKNKVYEMKGLGFLNMLQRARYLYGSLDVQSVPTQGSIITLTLNPKMNGAYH